MLDVIFPERGYGKRCYADCHIAERPFINLLPSVVMPNVTMLIHIFIPMLSVKLFNCCAECHIFIVMLSVTFLLLC
jgi:hypothetical protein